MIVIKNIKTDTLGRISRITRDEEVSLAGDIEKFIKTSQNGMIFFDMEVK